MSINFCYAAMKTISPDVIEYLQLSQNPSCSAGIFSNKIHGWISLLTELTRLTTCWAALCFLIEFNFPTLVLILFSYTFFCTLFLLSSLVSSINSVHISHIRFLKFHRRFKTRFLLFIITIQFPINIFFLLFHARHTRFAKPDESSTSFGGINKLADTITPEKKPTRKWRRV